MVCLFCLVNKIKRSFKLSFILFIKSKRNVCLVLGLLKLSQKEERLYFTIVYNLPLKEFNSIFPSADIISTVQFNHDGEFLATGDKGGRVVIFQKDLGVCTFV